MLILTSYKIGEVQFRLLGTNGFHVKAKNERFTAAGSRCRQNYKYENFTSLFGPLRLSKNCSEKRAARAARLFFLIQPIRSLFSGIVGNREFNWLNKMNKKK